MNKGMTWAEAVEWCAKDSTRQVCRETMNARRTAHIHKDGYFRWAEEDGSRGAEE